MPNRFSKSGLCLACVAILTLLPGGARAQSAIQDDFFNNLTPENIQAFLEKMDALSSGQMKDVSAEDMTLYFNRHLSDQGSYRSATTINIPGSDPHQQSDTMTKTQFIANVQQGQGMLKNDQTKIDIQDLQIADDKKSAMMKAVSTDNGMISLPDGKGGQQDTPVAGQSVCQESVALTKTSFLQLVSADCVTIISVTGAVPGAAAAAAAPQ